MKKWIIGFLIVVVVIGCVGFMYRNQLLLEGIGLLVKLRTPVGPHQEVDWSKSTAEAGKGDRPPNIVLIVADDLGWNDLTLNGGGVADGTVPTPHIDSLATEGVRFTNGYAACGTCAPSRAALMSGRYPTRFGFEFTPTPPGMLPMIARMAKPPAGGPQLITHFDEKNDQALPYEEMGLPTEEITLAETLKEAGYHTVHIGKWHLGRTNGMAPVDQGFDESLLMASGLYLPEDDPDVVNSKQDFDPIDRFLWAAMQHAASFNSGDAFEPGGYLTDYYTDEAVKVIKANKHRPFFLYLAHWAPHTPLQATRADYDALSHIKNHRLRVYAAMIRALDRGVGRVLDALKENGLDDNTLVMFTSDNGGAGYIALPEVNQPYRGWKITFFEGGIHVPYLMRWPAKIAAGSRFEKPVHHFDIFATAAAAAGASVPADRPIDGVDLLPFVPQTIVDGESDDGVKVQNTAPHDRLFWRGGHYQVVIAEGWKLQRTARPDKTWLFNLDTDPTEQNNVAAQNPDQVQKMLAMLDDHNAVQVDPAWPALLESPIRIDKTLIDPWDEDDEYIYWPN
jgi:arylsulfatase A-like enzyme